MSNEFYIKRRIRKTNDTIRVQIALLWEGVVSPVVAWDAFLHSELVPVFFCFVGIKKETNEFRCHRAFCVVSTCIRQVLFLL